MSGADAPTSADHALVTVREYLLDAEIDWELGGREGELVLVLPGEQKLRTVASLVVRDQTTSVSAFVIRNPDENHEEFYRFLLRRNLRMPHVAYAVDGSGDVYLKAEVPTAAVTRDYLDQLLGVVLDAADAHFNELLVIGFMASMRKEWDWRISRGEPTSNLEAFRHLLERPQRALESQP